MLCNAIRWSIKVGISSIIGFGLLTSNAVSEEALLFLASNKVFKARIEGETEQLFQVSGGHERVLALTALPDGRYVYAFRNGTGEMRALCEQAPPRLRASHIPALALPVAEPLEKRDLVLSPRGDAVLYVSRPREGALSWVLYRQELKSGNMLKMTPDGGIARAPSWSPNGRKIAYYYGEGTDVLSQGGFSLWIMDSDGKNAKQLAPASKMTRYNPDRDVPPIWAPDGSKIIFEANYPGDKSGPQIYSVQLSDGTLRRLSSGMCTSISPEGERLFFWDGGVYTMKVDGTQRKCLAAAQGRFRGALPKISPSGRRVAFISWEGIHLVDADGSRLRKITAKIPSPHHAFYWLR